MSIYLSSLIRAITAFHDLIENKIQNRQQQEEKDAKREEAVKEEKNAASGNNKKTAGANTNESKDDGSGKEKEKKWWKLDYNVLFMPSLSIRFNAYQVLTGIRWSI